MSGRNEELQGSFTEALYEWMNRAPWLALSAVAHVVLFVILSLFPWQVLRPPEVIRITASIDEAFVDPFEPPIEMPPEPLPPEPVDEVVPTLADSDLPVEDTSELSSDDSLAGDPEQLSAIDFKGKDLGELPGIGGPPGGKYGPRGTGNGRPAGRPRGTPKAVAHGLEWLAAHQSSDGSWDADGFGANCGALGSSTCDGPGESTHDIGVTGLALLAFLADGHTTRAGPYREAVTKGVRWLRDVQDPDTGLFGEEIGHAFLYNHAIASLAVCEAYYFSKSPLIRATAQRAVRYIEHARNPYGVWRYDVPPIGENDTSVTGWMVFVLKAAEDSGIRVDVQAYTNAIAWFDEVTDPATGRVGYVTPGSGSSRVPNVNDHYPAEKGEAMTAVALLSRFFLGQTPDSEPLMERHADLLLQSLPEWDPEGFGCDMYYWYYGTYAMYQMGGHHWRAWQSALTDAVQATQREDGDARGSWDPIGPWGYSGGRVYSTAMMVLSLEVYERYSRLTGARSTEKQSAAKKPMETEPR